MMKVQLLLLLALAGPLCAFTLSGITVNPTHPTIGYQHTTGEPVSQEVADHTIEDVSVVTGPSPTEPKTAAEVDAFSTAAPHHPDATTVETEAPAAPTVATDPPAEETAATTHPEHAEVPVATTQPEHAEVPVATTQPAHTEVPRVDEDPVANTQPPMATEGVKAAMEEDVIVENDTEGNLSTGQVVGIVIGALLAVAIVIAVVVAVLRRMGKYSP